LKADNIVFAGGEEVQGFLLDTGTNARNIPTENLHDCYCQGVKYLFGYPG
jgi:hypothetical protein